MRFSICFGFRRGCFSLLLLLLRFFSCFLRLFLLVCLLLRLFLRVEAFFLQSFQTLLLSSLFFLKFFSLLLRLFLALLGSTFTTRLLLLLTIVLLNNSTRVDHDRVNSRTSTAASTGVDVLVKRTPNQDCNQNDMQDH
ncbi:hypothetical protein D3C75_1078520 [compost metagenome]